jgi:hypothetical protein
MFTVVCTFKEDDCINGNKKGFHISGQENANTIYNFLADEFHNSLDQLVVFNPSGEIFRQLRNYIEDKELEQDQKYLI